MRLLPGIERHLNRLRINARKYPTQGGIGRQSEFTRSWVTIGSEGLKLPFIQCFCKGEAARERLSASGQPEYNDADTGGYSVDLALLASGVWNTLEPCEQTHDAFF